jgi:F0F1-type ATP synthase delta subunit
MRKKEYIQATYEILMRTHDIDTTLLSLKKLLELRGLMNLYPTILKGLLERIEHTQKTTRPTIIVVQKNDLTKYATEITREMSVLQSSDEPQIMIDPSLIGGFVIENGAQRIDQSFKTKLLHAYHRLTV